MEFTLEKTQSKVKVALSKEIKVLLFCMVHFLYFIDERQYNFRYCFSYTFHEHCALAWNLLRNFIAKNMARP